MKKQTSSVVVFAAALLLLSCSTKHVAVMEPEGINKPNAPITSAVKVLTINLAHGLKDNTDVNKFSDWVKSTGAEVVTVQRITRSTQSKPDFDAYGELLKRLDMRGTFAKARYYKGWDSGNALYCVYPLLQSNVYALPVGKGKVRKSLSFGLFELGLKPVAFASTDLDEEDAAERARQINEIVSIQGSMEAYPMIVTGNFGESLNGDSFLVIAEKYQSSNANSENLSKIHQQVLVPVAKKMKILSAEKIHYAPLNQAGVLVTIEVLQ